jgi:hypothetical protein
VGAVDHGLSFGDMSERHRVYGRYRRARLTRRSLRIG